jgi:hypothetical protein
MKKSCLACVFFLLLSSCADSNSPAPAPFDYSQEGKISLDVRDLTFVDRGIDQMPPSPPITTLKPSIADALHNWASQRLQAVGDDGIAAFVVKNAYVTEAGLPVDSNWFERPQAGKLTGHVEIELDARGKQGYALATANAVRSVTLPDKASDDEKQAAYNTMLNGMIQDLDRYLDQAIHEHMKDFIVGAPVIGSKLAPPPSADPAP